MHAVSTNCQTNTKRQTDVTNSVYPFTLTTIRHSTAQY